MSRLDEIRASFAAGGVSDVDANWLIASVEGLAGAARKRWPAIQDAQRICREQGFVFDERAKEGWPKLAFTFYTMLCEADCQVRPLLRELEGDDD